MRRVALERDGQLTAMLFDVVGPEPPDEAVAAARSVVGGLS